MRLSSRGWNNVLIFASLFMIVLFNTTHQKLMDGDTDTQRSPLVSTQAVIQVIDYSGVKLERIGANWRVQSSLELAEINAQALVNGWQELLFEVLPSAPELSTNSYSLPVLVQAIGLDSQQIFMVHVEPESGLVYFHNKVSEQWLLGSTAELPLLVPPMLLRES